MFDAIDRAYLQRRIREAQDRADSASDERTAQVQLKLIAAYRRELATLDAEAEMAD